MNKQKLLDFAEILDAYRVVPRMFMGLYGWMSLEVVTWFMVLDNPNGSQAALVSTVVGAGAAWFGFYANTGRKWGGDQ